MSARVFATGVSIATTGLLFGALLVIKDADAIIQQGTLLSLSAAEVLFVTAFVVLGVILTLASVPLAIMGGVRR